MVRRRSILTVLLLCVVAQTDLLAQHPTTAPAISQASPPAPVGAPVVFEGESLFTVYDNLGPYTPQERARAVTERLSRLAGDPFSTARPVLATDQGLISEILHGETVVMAVTDLDAQPTGKPRQELATEYARKIQAAVLRAREHTSFRALLIDAGLALLDTAILAALLILFHKTFPKLYARIHAWRGRVIRAIKVQQVELLTADQIADTLIGAVKVIRILAVLFLLYVYLTTVLGIFPWTRGLSATLLDAVLSTLKTIGRTFTTFVPDLISIVIIVLVTRFVIKLIRLLFNGIGRGAVTFPGFYQEWAEPTYKIVRFLVIVFAAIASFPYIPGSQSDGFRGISVFLGLLISLGSAAAFSNIIAGVVLTYMRAFRVGDRVKIADTIGDVMEKTLLVTRIRTIKNVDITIPNAMVLGSHIINFSACAQGDGLILHTSVTIGYDTPWRTVHRLLINAAKATTHVLTNPEPFVLQTGLNDFYVTYEVNAYTDQPNRMATTYAELHQNIQDKFNEAGVEIMSPHYTQLRDGNKTTIPDQYLPPTYQAPGLRVWPLSSPSSHPRPPSSD